MNQAPSQNNKILQEIHLLHNEAVIISKNLQRQEFLMLEILQKIDEKKVYRILGFKSLFQYSTIALKLSENRAYTFILVARKAKGLSKMQEALKSGDLSLSKAKRISSVISNESEDEWLKAAKVMTQRNLERAVAKVNPRSSIEEGARFISETVLEFRAAITTETEKSINRVMDLRSQSKGRPATYDEVLGEAMRFYLEHKDPVIKAQRILKNKMKDFTYKDSDGGEDIKIREATNSSQAASKDKSQDSKTRKRKPIPARLEHLVNLRDQGKCQKEFCHDSRWTDIHHVKPVSQGGENILENLITLCRSHHQMEHMAEP
jgi:hypothetical protein